ncbi:aldehyde dehydrogenase [Gracilaria domingensis]|nr:aldehyde dehydrogenase [Gracilaria domingensis]
MASTTIEHTSAAAVHKSLTASFSSGVTLPVNFRLSLLKKFRALLSKYEQQFEHALYADMRKHRYEVMTYEFSPVYMDLAYFINNLHRLSRPARASLEFGASVYLEKHPKGTVLVFGPFNYPIQSVLRPVVAAIAAGNTVCAKPSELTRATEAVYTKLAKDLDPRVFRVITGGVDIAQELLELRWDQIVFTGSGTNGKAVMTAAAKHLTPVILELGGKNPCIVTSTADIPTTVSSIVRGRFLNCGQTCLAVVRFPNLLTGKNVFLASFYVLLTIHMVYVLLLKLSLGLLSCAQQRL